ncbi:hypothetical protein N7532_004263 [Penicillium argentinense]|uniref:Mediator of RNA polymerase II transcription subunit 9 n=1 Tax=Penicillium argentinense TaxID=1131581 RepID=A0A9W9FP20_9EURO|nr:uncharacterized protein N7532_004263 [Penicillium argentinense]KAJ5103734.1 hypothetical protein N7532_004263 [Penicillium argentinense]
MASRSPTAATPLPKSSVAPESPSKDTNQTVPFPSPQTFEVLPPLHGVLLQLLSQKAPTDPTVGAPGDAPGASGASTEAQQNGQQPPSSIPGGGSNGPAASQAVADTSSIDPNVRSPLDVKDLPTATSSVKIRIEKARAVVEELPDMHRSVEEQQDEISELEDRITRLRCVISEFGIRARLDFADSKVATAA